MGPWNISKDGLNIHGENYRLLLKDSEDLNKWKAFILINMNITI